MDTLSAKGAAFVIGWPAAVAWLTGCPLECVAKALAQILDLDSAAAGRIASQMRDRHYVPEVGSLTRSQAIAVLDRIDGLR